MRTLQYKGKTLGNACSVFMYYKKNTGRGLQADVAHLSKISSIQIKLESSPEEITEEELEILNKADPGEIIADLYVALRQAGDSEAKRKSRVEIQEELEIADISDPELLETVTSLISGKKE